MRWLEFAGTCRQGTGSVFGQAVRPRAQFILPVGLARVDVVARHIWCGDFKDRDCVAAVTKLAEQHVPTVPVRSVDQPSAQQALLACGRPDVLLA